MSTIPPQLPPLASARSFSPLARPQVKAEKEVSQAPQDAVEIRSAAEVKPRGVSKGWVGAVALGALGLGAAASLVGGLSGPALGGTQVAQVQVQRQSQQSEGSIQLQSSRFAVTPTVRSFGSAPVVVSQDNYISPKTLPDGQQVEHEISLDRLMHQNGRALYSSDQAELSTLEFHDEGEASWFTQSELKPAGRAGKYVSVAETTTIYRGGASASTDIQLRTIDTETAQAVNLSELLSPEQYQRVAESVQKGLGTLAGLPYQAEDAETLDSHLNHSFALHQNARGETSLTVVIPASSDIGTVAEFVFSLPSGSLR